MNCRAGASPAGRIGNLSDCPTTQDREKAYAHAGVDVDVSNQPSLGRGDFNRAGLIEPYRLSRFSDDFVETRVVAQLVPNGIQL